MNRRDFVTRMTAGGGGLLFDHLLGAGQAEISPIYAESCAVVGLTSDGSQGVSMRIARFPAKGGGTLSATVSFGDQVWSAAVASVSLGAFSGRTRVEDPNARFDVVGDDHGWMMRLAQEDSLKGSSSVTIGTHPSAEPPPGRGPVPLVVDARFESGHRPINVRPGRVEVMGRVWATVRTPAGVRKFDGVGKWHEQIGDRARFGPAFTYLSVMGEQNGLLATKVPNGAYGYAWTGKQIVIVKAMEIEPIAKQRKFRVTLEDGRVIVGEAVTLRISSAPIEGQRRPGATVLVNSDLGAMVGHLNDWQPAP